MMSDIRKSKVENRCEPWTWICAFRAFIARRFSRRIPSHCVSIVWLVLDRLSPMLVT